MPKLALDFGHGGTDEKRMGFDPGALGNSMRECDLTTMYGELLHEKLHTGYEVDTAIMPRINGIKSQRLEARTDAANAWGADFLLSIHFNAFNGEASGYEDFIYDGQWPKKYDARTAQQIIHDKVATVFKRWGLTDRGAKEADLHMLRETKMNAVLVELGFIDNPKDAAAIRDKTFRDEVVNALAESIAEVMQLNKKEVKPPKDDVLYRVQVGAFSLRENAEIQLKELKKYGFEAIIKEERVK
jgi:N-acetylmuramoyl-L-alanine amidase